MTVLRLFAATRLTTLIGWPLIGVCKAFALYTGSCVEEVYFWLGLGYLLPEVLLSVSSNLILSFEGAFWAWVVWGLCLAWAKSATLSTARKVFRLFYILVSEWATMRRVGQSLIAEGFFCAPACEFCGKFILLLWISFGRESIIYWRLCQMRQIKCLRLLQRYQLQISLIRGLMYRTKGA